MVQHDINIGPYLHGILFIVKREHAAATTAYHDNDTTTTMSMITTWKWQ